MFKFKPFLYLNYSGSSFPGDGGPEQVIVLLLSTWEVLRDCIALWFMITRFLNMAQAY